VIVYDADNNCHIFVFNNFEYNEEKRRRSNTQAMMYYNNDVYNSLTAR